MNLIHCTRRKLLHLCVFLFLISSIKADEGPTVCACQPSSYNFTLDFSLDCNETTVPKAGVDPAIFDQACFIRGRSNNVTDPVPVSVSTIQVIEVDKNLDILDQVLYSDTYSSGDTISYTSIVTRDPTVYPHGIQLLITGKNAADEVLVNSWVILFNNEACSPEEYPWLTINQQIGWTVFSSLEEASATQCPNVQAPETSPPSDAVTTAVPITTTSPTSAIVETFPPSDVVTSAAPSIAPTAPVPDTVPPSDAVTTVVPSIAPTDPLPDTIPPSDAVTTVATTAPVATATPSATPVIIQTSAPTTPQTIPTTGVPTAPSPPTVTKPTCAPVSVISGDAAAHTNDHRASGKGMMSGSKSRSKKGGSMGRGKGSDHFRGLRRDLGTGKSDDCPETDF